MKRLPIFLLLLAIAACDSGNNDNEDKRAVTVLTSSSLAPSIAAPKAPHGVVRMRGNTANFEVTPSNVTGQVLSVVFPIDPAPDDGIVVFGDGRPDIAPTSAQLFPFDFADQLSVSATIEIKPTLADGTVERVHPLFGYADFEYTQLDGTERTVRVAMASVDGMTRGDKLLETVSGFQWFDLDSGTFNSTRPSNPAVIPEIRDFTDPIRPNLVFFPVTVDLTSTINIVAADFLAATSIESEVDFFMGGAITLVGQTTSDISEEELIQAFTLTQISGSTGFDADATLVAIP